jgi:Lysozyme like domain
MAVLTPRQVAASAYAGGFRGSELAPAVAIALAESSGDPHATNHNSNGSTDYGLWQINSIHSQILASGRWDDPASNGKMAFKVYSDAGKKFTPWVTYNTGAYRMHLARAVLATKNLGGISPPPADPNAPGLGKMNLPDISGITNFVEFAFNPSNWRRVGIFLGGLILMFLGLHGIVKDTAVYQAGKAAAQKAAKVAVKTAEVAAIA